VMERKKLGIIVKKGLSEEGTFQQTPGERERSKSGGAFQAKQRVMTDILMLQWVWCAQGTRKRLLGLEWDV